MSALRVVYCGGTGELCHHISAMRSGVLCTTCTAKQNLDLTRGELNVGRGSESMNISICQH